MSEFKKFKKECKRLIKVFGLSDWSVKYSYLKMDVNGRATFNNDHLWCELKLSKTPCNNYKGAIWTARHEVGHILFAEISEYAYTGASERIIDLECERFANRFANGLEVK